MKKILLFILCTVFLNMFTACSYSTEVEPDITGEPAISTPEPVPEETAQPYAEPIESLEIYSAKMWNEFAEAYNNEREKYADYITVKIIGELDFEYIDFVPLADGFSGKITGTDAELGEAERQLWIRERKKWPLDYKGTFMNISRIKDIDGEKTNSLFGSVGELELENVSFAFVYLDDVKCLFAESADSLKLYNVRVQNCTLPDGRSIAVVNSGNISAEYFIGENCVLTGYGYMGGIACFVSGDAGFKDIFLSRCNFTLSPDNGGSGLWSAGIGLLTKSVSGTAAFENIDIYGCSSSGLYTHALANSVGEASKCSNVSLEFCTFMNYRSMSSEYNSGIMGSCGEAELMDVPVFEENISITNSNICGRYREVDFENRGYIVDNSIFTSVME